MHDTRTSLRVQANSAYYPWRDMTYD